MILDKLGRRLFAPAVLFLACCGVYWKLVLSRQYTWVDSPDLVRMEVPRFGFQRAAWQAGEFPLWDPYQWCGQPFLGQVTGAAFPGNWIFSWLPFNREGRIPLGQLHWYFFLVHWLGGLFCYRLCRDLGLSRGASLGGACAFAFCGFFNVFNWPVMMTAVMWAPLIFLYLLRALRGEREWASAALSGFFTGVAWLAGHHEVPIYFTMTLGAVWAWFTLLPPEGKSRIRMAALGALSLGTMALAGGLQIVPALEYGQRVIRWAGGPGPVGWKDAIAYSVHTANGWHASSIPSLFIAWYGPEGNVYVGVVALALAVIAVLRLWPADRAVRVLACVAIGAALMAMAGQNILHGFLYAVVPVFGKARNPVRILAVVNFAIAPLAAFGMQALLDRAPWPGWRRVAAALAWSGGAVYLAISASRVFGVEPKNEFVVFSALMALLVALLIALWLRDRIDPRVLAALLVTLIVVDTGMVASSFPARVPEKGQETWMPWFDRYADIAAFLKKQPDPKRVMWTEETLDINLGDFESLESYQGFSASATENVVLLELGHERQQDLFALNYTVSKTQRRSDAVELFRGASGYAVYRNPSAFPRTWIVHSVFHAKNRGEVTGRVREYNFDLRTGGVMTAPPPALATCEAAGEESRLVGRSANTVALEAKLNCRGIVVLADAYFPGWSATVDGRPAEIHELYGALRGVVADAGTHRIEMRYRPATALAGAGMSALACLLILGLAIKESGPRSERARAAARLSETGPQTRHS